MTKMEGSTVIERPLEAVWKYLARVENIPKWDEGVLDASQTSEGPLGVGTTIQYIRNLFGRRWTDNLQYVEYEPNQGLAFQFTSGPLRQSLTRYALKPAGTGTRLTTSGDIQLHGIYQLLAPLLLPMRRRADAAALGNMKRILEARA